MTELSILFLCTGNACRSQMAEGWARELFARSPLSGRLKITIYSAGVEAHGVNPRAVETMAEVGIDIGSQSSDILDPALLDEIDYLVTLCGSAVDRCPVVPSTAVRLHWDLPDPARAENNHTEVFASVRDAVKEQVVKLVGVLEQQYPGVQTAGFEASGYTLDQVELISRESKYSGFLQLEKCTLRHRLFAGGWSKNFTRELLRRGEAVVVLPYDVERDELVLIEQFRIGALEDGRSPWLLECVAGMVEAGETPEAVAVRETLEEAGCEVSELVHISSCWPSPGGCSEKIHIYCGKTCSEGVGGIHGLDHEDEDIRVHLVTSEQAGKLLEDGVINNAAAIIAIQWLQLNKASLVGRWR